MADSEHFFDGQKSETHLMSTPSKSPLPKRLKGDDAPEDDEAVMNDEDDGVDDVPENVTGMFKSMMKMMRNVQSEVKGIKQEVQEAKDLASQAKFEARTANEAAQRAEIAVATLQSSTENTLKSIKADSVSMEAVQDMIDKSIAKAKDAGHISNTTSSIFVKDNLTAVIGGLQDASSAEAAKSWVKETMEKSGIREFAEVYDKCKNTPFNGMVFVKFQSVDKRDDAIVKFNSSKHQLSESSEKASSMSKDRPIQKRVPFGFLLGVKRLMMSEQWQFENVQFDADTGVLTLAGVDILRVSVSNFDFNMTWLDDEWAGWNEFVENPEFQKLIKAAKDKLAKAQKGSGKGKGKKPASA